MKRATMREPIRKLEAGMVVQLKPDADGFFSGCFMLITEPKPWGAQGFVAIPGKRGETPGRAFYRAKFEDMEFVGFATWIPEAEVIE